MFIKLLCVNTAYFSDCSTGFIIEEGDIVNALINREGICFEYKKNFYSSPYDFEDVKNYFISAFDEEAFNKIYQKVSNCKMYLDDGKVIELGDAIAKAENFKR